MQLDITVEPNETVNNFTLAGAIYETCENSLGDLDAETIATMLMAQVDRNYRNKEAESNDV